MNLLSNKDSSQVFSQSFLFAVRQIDINTLVLWNQAWFLCHGSCSHKRLHRRDSMARYQYSAAAERVPNFQPEFSSQTQILNSRQRLIQAIFVKNLISVRWVKQHGACCIESHYTSGHCENTVQYNIICQFLNSQKLPAQSVYFAGSFRNEDLCGDSFQVFCSWTCVSILGHIWRRNHLLWETDKARRVRITRRENHHLEQSIWEQNEGNQQRLFELHGQLSWEPREGTEECKVLHNDSARSRFPWES